VLRVSQTLADLEGHDTVTLGDILTALSLRQPDLIALEPAA
jgi:predicted ATPase with chaperone activity